MSYNFIDEINNIVENNEIQEVTKDFLGDALDTLFGNPLSGAKLLSTIIQSPFLLREKIFWNKFSKFLGGVYQSERDKEYLREKFEGYVTKGENAERLISYIDRADTSRKIDYLIHVTRCLLTDVIDISTYFRVCNAVIYTLQEDLIFLKENIGKENIGFNECVQGLLTAGLMYQSVLDEKGEHQYSFTRLAELTNACAINYVPDNLSAIQSLKDSKFVKKITVTDNDEPITKEDIESIFNGTYEIRQ